MLWIESLFRYTIAQDVDQTWMIHDYSAHGSEGPKIYMMLLALMMVIVSEEDASVYRYADDSVPVNDVILEVMKKIGIS